MQHGELVEQDQPYWDLLEAALYCLSVATLVLSLIYLGWSRAGWNYPTAFVTTAIFYSSYWALRQFGWALKDYRKS